MKADRGIEWERLQQLAEDYRALGYAVSVHPDPQSFGLPEWMRPDLVAVGKTDRVLVEIKSLLEATKSQEIQSVAQAVEHMGGWRFELVLVNPVDRDEIPHEDIPLDVSETLVRSRTAAARRLLTGEGEAALVMAWSAVEAALRALQQRVQLSTNEANDWSAKPNIRSLYSLGVLSEHQFELLRQAAEKRNQIVHGLPSEEMDEEIVEKLADLAEEVIDKEYVSVSEMVEWFFEHYVDPANRVPFDSREGGYQYVLGGPYDAEDVLREQFPNASSDLIAETVDEIETQGFEWVKKDQY